MAMIKVYDSNEKLFNNNGIKIIHPLRADITKIDNGDYFVELQDKIESLEFYQNGMIVRIPTPWGVQGFRLANPKVKNNKVEVKGWHLTYDARNYIIQDAYAVDKNCNDALEHFNSATDTPSPFTTLSDISTISSTRAVRRTLFEMYELLLSADRYGGHWFRDNWTLGIKEKVGEDRGVVLKLGKNITDIQVDENWDDVCTKILPYTTNGEVAILLDETYVELAEQLYDIPYTKVVQFENAFAIENFETEEEYLATVKNWLRGQAETYLEEHKLPKVNYSVSAHIDNVSDVGDTLQVKHPKCKVDILTEVISVQYDAIRKKYTKIEFGNFKKELKNLSQNITAEANKHTDEAVKETQTLLKGELETATAKINGVLGNSYAIYEGDKILVVDTLPKENAVNVLKISNGGIGFSNSGINGQFTSAWTLDGTLNMQNINVINLTASLIKGGTLKLGGQNNSSGTFELYDETNNLIALMDRSGLTVYAKNGDYVKLNAEDGFVGYNPNGERIYWADGDTFHMYNAEVENQIKMAKKIKIVPVTTAEHIGVGFVAISGGELNASRYNKR
jgi:phage minor structural protein